MKTSQEIRQIFHDFWQSSPRNHKAIPNASLVPVGDSTILFVNSGMFPLVPYLGGEKHPLGTRLENFQRSLRTDSESIEEIGDNRHTLMFEMMGNWSLGDYFKEGQLPWVMELYHERFGLDIQNLYVSVFSGDEAAPRDEESIEIWKQVFAKYGIEALVSDNPQDVQLNFDENGKLKDRSKSFRIFTYPAKKNWWQRGVAPGELGGPDSEIFYDLGPSAEAYTDPDLHINGDNGRFIEVGNSVFIQFKMDEQLKWQTLAQKNVDFGGGFERVVMCVQGKNDIFETDLFQPILDKISELSGKHYKTDNKENEFTKAFRVLADHSRVSTFIIADGIKPSNKDQGYILRRFIRRLIRFGKKLGLENNFTTELASAVIDRMSEAYPHLAEQRAEILATFEKEETLFRQTLNRGLKEFDKLIGAVGKEENGVTKFELFLGGEQIFYLYETYGFPPEMTIEELKNTSKSRGLVFTEQTEQVLMLKFQRENQKHQEQSRAGAEQKFKGGLADHSEEVIKLHTAHHLLLRALQIVVGDHVKQRGSNITGERLRIDFSNPDKLTDEQVARVEQIVNEKIQAGLSVERREMPKSEAESIGAEMEFGQKYPDIVTVYVITDTDGTAFSKEFCGGPHVANTSEIGAGGKTFKIQKQENVGSGVRRIKAALV